MSSINLSTALSGVSAANERLRASQSAAAAPAPDIAGLKTVAAQPSPPVEPSKALVEQQSSTYAFVANLRVLQTQLRAEGAMLDIHA